MHGDLDPLSPNFFPQKLILAAILNRDNRWKRFWWNYLVTATSLLHTKFEVSSARDARVISVWKADMQYYRVYTSDDSKWSPWWNQRSYTKTETNVSILDWIPIEWRWFGHRVVYRPRDPLSPNSYASIIVRIHMIFQNGRRCKIKRRTRKPK